MNYPRITYVVLFLFYAMIHIIPEILEATAISSLESYQHVAKDLKHKIAMGQVRLSDISPLVIVAVPTTLEDKLGSLGHRANLMTNALRQNLASLQVAICDRCLRGEVTQTNERLLMTSVLSPPGKGTYSNSKAGIWLTRHDQIVSYRVASLQSGAVLASSTLVSGNAIDTRSRGHYTKAHNLERLAAGKAIFHTYADFGFYPSLHASYNFVEQWGETGVYQTGLSLSIVTPVLGLGVVMYKAIPSLNNTLVGGKILLSIPAAISRGASSRSDQELDPLLTYIIAVRIPVPSESGRFGVYGFLSHTGNIGLGVSF